MTRKSKQDWLEKGLKILAKESLNGLTIDKMALELGVTKGSFYHHFKNARDFEERLLGYWANQYLSTTATLPEDIKTALKQIREGKGKLHKGKFKG